MDSTSDSDVNYMYDGLNWGAASKDGNYEYHVGSFIVTPSKMTISGIYILDNISYEYEFHGNSDGGNAYSGNFCVPESSCVSKVAVKKDNPYYFTPYQS
ncbi:MAG: hypothetical protein GY710_20760 [Desulfobacteraceae bacterium]|nr:hypothetical protein [Desulfobacteraceae bacterium]